jgi:hypothetical protein
MDGAKIFDRTNRTTGRGAQKRTKLKMALNSPFAKLLRSPWYGGR